MSSERNYKFRWQEAFAQNGPSKLATMRVGMAMANKDNGIGYGENLNPQGFFASVDELCHASGMSERSVKAARKELVEVGWFIKTRDGGRSGDGKRWASEYVLNIPDGMEYVPWVQGQGANLSPRRANPGSQRADPSSQGARWSTPLDPNTLDPGSLDPGSLDPKVLVAAEKKILKPSDLAEPDDSVPDEPPSLNAWAKAKVLRRAA